MSHNLPQTILQTEHKMSVEEVCRKYNTDCVQVRMGGAKADVGGLGLSEEGSAYSWMLVLMWGVRASQGRFLYEPHIFCRV